MDKTLHLLLNTGVHLEDFNDYNLTNAVTVDECEWCRDAGLCLSSIKNCFINELMSIIRHVKMR